MRIDLHWPACSFSILFYFICVSHPPTLGLVRFLRARSLGALSASENPPAPPSVDEAASLYRYCQPSESRAVRLRLPCLRGLWCLGAKRESGAAAIQDSRTTRDGPPVHLLLELDLPSGPVSPKGNNAKPNLTAAVSAVTTQPAGTAYFCFLQRLLGFSSSLIVVTRLVKPTMLRARNAHPRLRRCSRLRPCQGRACLGQEGASPRARTKTKKRKDARMAFYGQNRQRPNNAGPNLTAVISDVNT